MSADTLDLEITMDQDQEVDQAEVLERESSLPPVICYRDPADVRTIRRQSRLLLLALFVTATAVIGVVYKSIQRPDRIVVDMSSGRTVMINNRELGATEAVRLEKDKLQIADMDYVVKTYLDYLYRVDQRSRAKDIEAALRLMVPGQAKKFAQYLTEQKVLQTQREQQWSAIWKARAGKAIDRQGLWHTGNRSGRQESEQAHHQTPAADRRASAGCARRWHVPARPQPPFRLSH